MSILSAAFLTQTCKCRNHKARVHSASYVQVYGKGSKDRAESCRSCSSLWECPEDFSCVVVPP